jgi:hypothetical protein
MSEAGGGSSRAEMERRLIQRSMEGEDFRQRLLEDHKGTLEQELERLPDGVEVRALEESAEYHLPRASQRLGGRRRRRRALRSVAGGGGRRRC